MRDDEVMCRDVHPAEILLPDGRILHDVRVFVTSHRLGAFAVTPGRVIERVVDAELAEPFSVPASRNTLRAGALECRLADGTAWVNRGRGCGCHSPLKALSGPVPWTRTAVAAAR